MSLFAESLIDEFVREAAKRGMALEFAGDGRGSGENLPRDLPAYALGEVYGFKSDRQALRDINAAYTLGATFPHATHARNGCWIVSTFHLK